MAEFNYESNSHKSKEEKANLPAEKKVERVVTGKVSKKKNSMRKLTDNFISDDVHNVKNYVLMDVLIPAAKKAISDIITNGIDMILYGESGRRDDRRTARVDRFSYDQQYGKNNDRRSYSSRPGYDYDDITIYNRAEAEEVLRKMDEIIDMYKVVSVADLYDLVGVTGNYTDNKYGWTNLRNAEVVRGREGYKLKLPKALPLD